MGWQTLADIDVPNLEWITQLGIGGTMLVLVIYLIKYFIPGLLQRHDELIARFDASMAAKDKLFQDTLTMAFNKHDANVAMERQLCIAESEKNRLVTKEESEKNRCAIKELSDATKESTRAQHELLKSQKSMLLELQKRA